MALVSHSKHEITYKIVYYGTGLGGKTTNLRFIHNQLSPKVRGQLVTLSTETERTLYFDFLPVEIGSVRGFKVRIAIYTVPGQIEYNESRRVILKNVDGIVFVADSEPTKATDNVESLQNMIDNLATYGMELSSIPWVLQYNKRDLAVKMPIEVMEKSLNIHGVPSYEAVALEGLQVFATLKGITKLLVQS